MHAFLKKAAEDIASLREFTSSALKAVENKISQSGDDLQQTQLRIQKLEVSRTSPQKIVDIADISRLESQIALHGQQLRVELEELRSALREVTQARPTRAVSQDAESPRNQFTATLHFIKQVFLAGKPYLLTINILFGLALWLFFRRTQSGDALIRKFITR